MEINLQFIHLIFHKIKNTNFKVKVGESHIYQKHKIKTQTTFVNLVSAIALAISYISSFSYSGKCLVQCSVGGS